MHTINIKIQWKLICLPIASRAQIRVDGGIWRGQENLQSVSILHSVVSWSVMGPQSGAIEGEADHNEAKALWPCLPQYAFINFLSGVVFLILKLTTAPFWSLTCRSNIKMISEN